MPKPSRRKAIGQRSDQQDNDSSGDSAEFSQASFGFDQISAESAANVTPDGAAMQSIASPTAAKGADESPAPCESLSPAHELLQNAIADAAVARLSDAKTDRVEPPSTPTTAPLPPVEGLACIGNQDAASPRVDAMENGRSPGGVRDATAPELSVGEYLPARMLNEFVYCPRLFYYEWVENVFAHSRDTVEGALRHARVDEKQDPLAPAEELAPDERLHSRSVMVASETHRLIAKIDLVEAAGAVVTPIDYKRGAPQVDRDTGLPRAWDPDRVQIAAQALALRDNGYECQEGVLFYMTTRQRIRVPIDESLLEQTLAAAAAARAAVNEPIPPPLVDSPKCPKCSLVAICLPDETRLCRGRTNVAGARQGMLFDVGPADIGDQEPADEPRRLVAARDDLRPLYLNTQGLFVGKSGNVLKIKDRDKLVQEVRIGETCQVNVFGNIQLSTQAVQALCENEVPVAYFSMGGWFYGATHGLGVRNIYLRREQFRLAEASGFCLRIAKALTVGKIKNQRTMLQRNHVEPPAEAILFLKALIQEAERIESIEQLLGIEGVAARTYFERFAGMIKSEEGATPGETPREFNFSFAHRNRRPPRDPVNALLSLAYSVLAKDLTIVCHAVGFDPYLGFYHQPRFGRAALALDLMEPFRPLIADSAVLTAINTRMVTASDFVRTGQAVALKPEGRKAFFRAYEQRMDTLVTHPLFGYRVNYRRVLEIQARLLARVLTGEISHYPAFVTR